LLVGLALGAENLMFILHHAVTGWMLAPLLAAHLAAGLLAGILYFRALRRTTEMFANGGSVAAVLWMGACRFAGLGLVLFLAALEGAWPLLCMAAGVLLARCAMLRRARESAA
jgi:hypothetical protein